MLDEELCEIGEKKRAGYEWFENNGVRFYASDVRLWAVGGILFFFYLKVVVAVTKKQCTCAVLFVAEAAVGPHGHHIE